jgi:hypothetical protein
MLRREERKPLDHKEEEFMYDFLNFIFLVVGSEKTSEKVFSTLVI